VEDGTLFGNCLIVVTWGTSVAAAGAGTGGGMVAVVFELVTWGTSVAAAGAGTGGGMVAVVFELNFASLEATEGSAAAEGAAGGTGAD
jgi:hypothetical protein